MLNMWSYGAHVFYAQYVKRQNLISVFVPVGVLSYLKYSNSTGVTLCPVEHHLICIQWLFQFNFDLSNMNLHGRKIQSTHIHNIPPIPFTSFWKPAGGQVWWIWLYIYCTEVRRHVVYLDYISQNNLKIIFFFTSSVTTMTQRRGECQPCDSLFFCLH